MTERIPLVLVPGLLCDALLWQPQIAALSSIADVTVADHTRHPRMDAIAADILATVGHPRFALAGLSMGGYVAFEMWRQAPHRIDRIALLGTSARPDTPEQSERRERLIELAARGRFIGVGTLLLPLLVHPDRLTDHALVDTIRTMTERVGRDAFIRQEQAVLGRPDSRPMLASIDRPALVLCGRDDELTPVDRHVEMADALPRAELVVVGHCGHLSTLERPDAVNRALAAWLVRD